MGNPDKPFCLTGLSAAQVQQKKESGKQNLPPKKSTKSTSQILKDNICTLFNLFNVLIAIALALVGAWSNMMFICIIAVNTLIGIVQELHAKKLVEKLSLLSAPTVRVIRDGKHSEILIHELVEQDVIELEAGQFPLRIGWSRLWRHWMGKAPFLTEVSNYTASLSRQMERTIKLLSIIQSFPCQV